MASVKFSAHICVDFILTKCPSEGFAALDWRREHGFRERLDNEYRVDLDGPICEASARKLVEAGWLMDSHGTTGAVRESPLGDHSPERGSISVDIVKPVDDISLLCVAHAIREMEARKP